MYKTMSVYTLPEGTDPDEFWKYHTQVHAIDVKKAAGPTLKKYVINRVIDVLRGTPNFFGVIEMWWESKAAREGYSERAKLVKTATGKSPPEDFGARVINGFSVHLEEKEITLGNPRRHSNLYKTMSVYALPDGTDPDEFWKYHTQVHAMDVKKAAGPTLNKYVINRVVDVMRGEPKFFGIIQMWWESKETREGYSERAKLVKTATGKSPPEDFGARVISGFAVHLEEKEILL
jgi:hypothetical protein